MLVTDCGFTTTRFNLVKKNLFFFQRRSLRVFGKCKGPANAQAQIFI
jgi:hypothetical protein